MKGFGHSLRVVTIAHVVVIAVIAIVSGCRSLFARKRPTVIPVEFMVEAPAAPVVIEAPPAPKPAPPEPAPKPLPKPTRKKPVVKRSDRRVARPQSPKQAVLSETEIKKLLMQGAKRGPTTQIPDEDARGFASVRAALYRAWGQPSRDEVGDAEVQAVIALAPGGRVIARRLAVPSGNPSMDASVLAALNATAMIPGLSDRFIATHKEITIAFRVE